ncbi:hypothetical protein [Citrobacter koseri]|uniref:hypothetical protein n=1 Tax=Citrobacter koseri TaxID=545 RepID=UPI000D99C5BD|nr:hypothetical protein [Citrobacter koseri]SQB62327.1 Uncharacterised protein [Citrobacter koseri]
MKSTVETKIIELVKLGHARAAELKGSFEAINACSVAQLISDLATQLDVQFARSNALAAKLSMINGLMDAAEQANKLAQEATEKLVQERDALAAELSAVESIHNDAVFITDEHYEQCPREVQKIVRSLAVLQIPAYDSFLDEVRAQGVEQFLKGSQLPYQIATVLADYDNVDDATLQTVIWSGQPPEPDGDVWHLEYVSRGNAIVRAVLNDLRKGVQS